jgi:hypothetical protein
MHYLVEARLIETKAADDLVPLEGFDFAQINGTIGQQGEGNDTSHGLGAI